MTYDIQTSDPEGAKRLCKVARICQNYGQRV
ncbi:MAG: CRISPR-associated endonuclease Cas2 [Bacteroides sp.]|nr:CRISPR-associated endonuclease Cas2 [Bacteroides sp.]